MTVLARPAIDVVVALPVRPRPRGETARKRGTKIYSILIRVNHLGRVIVGLILADRRHNAPPFFRIRSGPSA